LQIKAGSCNGIGKFYELDIFARYHVIIRHLVMGKIPSTSNMVSSILVFPTPGQSIQTLQTFNISVQTVGLVAGSFTNAQSTYYAAPQDLSSQGQIIGHVHVTVQDLGSSLAPTTPPDPTAFVFFKGINDAGNNKGLVQATVTGGLPAGNYRVCTILSSSNHQPVLMPVAQRGAQDDCQKFTVNSVSSSTSAIGGIEAPAITSSGDSSRPFAVNGNTFVSQSDAKQRACSIQNNLCANAVNAGKVSGATVADCSAQQATCNTP
jgi:transcription initiation factor TFIID subunit 15